jgi:cation:H+ antiporter
MQYPLNISELALFVAGLALLSGGAEMVVRGALRLAASLGIEPLMLGLTVVAIGTSTPELVIGITASWQGSGALAVGNIAGTNMVNILLILGLSALLRPLPLHLRVLKLDLPVMIIAAAMMTIMAWDGLLTRLDGGVLFGAAILYTVVLIRVGRGEKQAVKAEFRDMYSDDIKTRWAVAQTKVRYIVLGAVGIARAFGISEAVIGLTIVAIGTSAPELATTIVATIKGERDVAIGNLLGSSIYNIFVILGLTCLVSPGGVPVERQLMFVDIPLMAGVALLCIPVFVTGKRVSRWEGGALIAFYVIYMLSLIFSRS